MSFSSECGKNEDQIKKAAMPCLQSTLLGCRSAVVSLNSCVLSNSAEPWQREKSLRRGFRFCMLGTAVCSMHGSLKRMHAKIQVAVLGRFRAQEVPD